MLSFAKVGKKQLLNIIHIQENYKIETEPVQIISHTPVLCASCPTYESLQLFEKAGMTEQYNTVLKSCLDCPNCVKTMESKVKYINERNQYGYQPALKTNAILLFIAYHFYPVDANGIIKRANIADLAELLGCDKKTIRNNNEILTRFGYIFHGSEDCDGDFVVMIKNYSDNFKPANEGGRGYLNLSRQTFNELIKIRKLNALRIYIREMVETEAPATNIDKAPSPVVKKYREMLRALPTYCNRSIIQSAIEYARTVTNMFTVSMDQKQCRFELRSDFDVRKALDESMRTAEQEVSKICSDLQLETSKTIKALVSYYQRYFEYPAGIDLPAPEVIRKREKDGKEVVYSPSIPDLIDFKKIAVQYGTKPMRKALSILYKEISLRGTTITNPGGYIRKLLQLNPEFSALV